MINKRFIIKKKLGEGRSKVFLCSDNDNPEKDYAIKILPVAADENEIKVFRNEFFTLQKLNHPNIIASHEEGVVVECDDKGIKAGSKFIILDYFPGTDLLSFDKLIDERNLKTALAQICSVLYYLHQSNYIYYDLKPDNILVSEIDGELNIKMIDMGFAHHSSSGDEFLPRGTTEYIAPEILKNETHNHKVDLYSLGIMLYRIIYKKFPFRSESVLEIYKEQIENEFDFPGSNYSPELINATKKLLVKDPVERYDSVLQFLKDIDIDITPDITKNFTPASVFSDRLEIISQINKSLTGENNQDVIVISGVEGSGKTSLIYDIYSTHEKVIFLGDTGRRKSISFIQYFLKKAIFSEFIHPFLEENVIRQVNSILSGRPENLISNLKSIFTKVSLAAKFTIIIDDFNFLDEFTLDIFREVLPILQVNKIKIILTERSDHESLAKKIINKTLEINLFPFTEADLDEYLDKALATFFPKDQLKGLIVGYADLLPGSIINFVRDLILLNIIKFAPDGAEIITGEKTKQLLESSHEEIFRLRISLLSDNEMNVARFISSFGISTDVKVISALNRLSVDEVYRIVRMLERKNILQVSNITDAFTFTSDSLKKYIYSTIGSKDNYHIQIAKIISKNLTDFNRQELARHYELGKDFMASYNILSEEIEEADRLFAYSYEKNILNHLLKLPLDENYQTELSYKLSSTLYKLDDPKSALEIIEKLLLKQNNENLEHELMILKGSCLIELGELDVGKSILIDLIGKISDEGKKQKLIMEVAYAEFDLGKYDTSESRSREIISNNYTTVEEKAKSHNLLGLIEIYQRNDLDKAVKEFQKSLEYYKQINSTLQEAKIERNIGNIYNMKGEHSKAEQYWNSAHQKNLSIGNLDQEARHLLNYGIYYYEQGAFDEAIKQYKEANEIFMVLGNKDGEGLALTNLGEVNLDICNYQEAYDSLIEAREIFNKMANIDEEAEVLFLLGKLYFTVGVQDELNSIINLYKKTLSEITERHKNNIEFLELLSRNSLDETFIKEIKIKYQGLNDRANYSKANILFCEACINNGNYSDAFDAVNDEEFLRICGENSLVKAHREFLIGEISAKSERLDLPPSFKCYSASYEILEDSYITELTWKVLLKLSELYYDRGNLAKISDYILYAKKILYFIADQIKDDNLRDKYLNRPDRASAIEKIKFLEKELS